MIVIDKFSKMRYNERATQFYTHFLSKRAYVGKNAGFACHVHLDVKLCSNNERNCVFRCVVSTTHLFISCIRGIENAI